MYKMHNDNRKALYIFADAFYMYKWIEIMQRNFNQFKIGDVFYMYKRIEIARARGRKRQY